MDGGPAVTACPVGLAGVVRDEGVGLAGLVPAVEPPAHADVHLGVDRLDVVQPRRKTHQTRIHLASPRGTAGYTRARGLAASSWSRTAADPSRYSDFAMIPFITSLAPA